MRTAFSDAQIIELVATAAAWEFFTRFVDALRIPTTPLAPALEEEGGRRRPAGGKRAGSPRTKAKK